MQQNINPCNGLNQYQHVPLVSPNAVNINIIQPQAFTSPDGSNCNAQNFYPQSYYPLYQTNQNPNLPLYPMNYNNMIQYPNASAQPYTPSPNSIQQQYATSPYNLQQPYIIAPQQFVNPNYDTQQVNNALPVQNQNANNSANAYSSTNLMEKTKNPSEEKAEVKTKETDKKDKDKPKTITLLTDDYIKSLENYLNDSNPKMRLIAAKEVMERFKEDDSRIANPSLTALLNKMLRDSSPSVRFLGLTTLQLGYSVGNDETVSILKEIQTSNKDEIGEDSVLASEILLKLAAPKIKEVK